LRSVFGLMSVSADSRPKYDGRDYPQLPPGQQPWFAEGAITGDASGGEVTQTISFNIDLSDSYMPYLSIDAFSFFSYQATLTGAVRVFGQSSEWERAGIATHFDVIAPTYAESSTLGVGVSSAPPLYLGRAIKGKAARLYLVAANVNACSIYYHFSGLASDAPFVADYNTRY